MEYKRYGGNEDLYRYNRYDGTDKVIMEGEFKERHFVILAHHGGHPNAYLEVKKTDSMYKRDPKEYDDFLWTVHCGSTYYGNAYWDENDKRTYVGWDYGHYGDYSEAFPDNNDTKWDIIDILMEIAGACTEIYCRDELKDQW